MANNATFISLVVSQIRKAALGIQMRKPIADGIEKKVSIRTRQINEFNAAGIQQLKDLGAAGVEEIKAYAKKANPIDIYGTDHAQAVDDYRDAKGKELDDKKDEVLAVGDYAKEKASELDSWQKWQTNELSIDRNATEAEIYAIEHLYKKQYSNLDDQAFYEHKDISEFQSIKEQEIIKGAQERTEYFNSLQPEEVHSWRITEMTGKPVPERPDSFYRKNEHYGSLSAFPESGLTDTMYIANDTHKTYRWTGSAYEEMCMFAFTRANGK